MMFLRCAGLKTERLEMSILDGIIAQYRTRQGEIMLHSEDEIILWRFALPRPAKVAAKRSANASRRAC